MKVVILGAGLLGVATAWYLAEDGHEVTVLDRQAAPAMETTFANGGQISSCHAVPRANPGAPWQVLKWMEQKDSSLLWRLRADPAQWAWGMRLLVERAAAKARKNTIDILWLALQSAGLSGKGILNYGATGQAMRGSNRQPHGRWLAVPDSCLPT